MFDSIGDLPLHPLAIHAAVLGVPVTFLLAVLFTVPRTRNWARYPLALAGVGALGAVFVARESGEALQAALLRSEQLGGEAAVLVDRHASMASTLLWLATALAVLAVTSAVVVGRLGGTAERRGGGVRDTVLLALLLIVAAVASIWVYRVGDLGATAVWNPSGTQTYSSTGR